MYEQEFQGDVIYMMLYAVVAALNLVACCYLLFRRANAIAPDVTPPVRLRRWTAAFFASITLCHLWYLPMYYLTSSEDIMLGYQIAGLLDCMTVIPLLIVILFTMLQDRRRSLWPVCVAVTPLIVGRVWCVATRNEDILLMLFVYFTLMSIALVIYMVRATRQYGRWLRDNYADLEHKEVWQSFVALAIILLTFAIYSFDMGDMAYEYAMEVNIMILVCYLLWRVETLSDLSTPIQTDIAEDEDNTLSLSERHSSASPLGLSKNIEPLLKQYCEEPHLYLQHDINISRLAREIGINRLYLSQYFSSQGMNYNAYINDLRINHFISLYHETVAAHRPVIAQQLAFESGYQSYNTFRDAFKRKTGQSVTAWMARQKMEV